MTKLPSKFQIRTKHDDISRYTLTIDESSGQYLCRNVTSLDDAYDYPTSFSESLVQAAINSGNWIITKSLDEPELKFPFYCTHANAFEGSPEESFKVEKGNNEVYVKVTWQNGRVDTNFWDTENVKRLIKEGIWIVKHVGEKAEEKAPQEPPQAPESTPLSTVKLTIECDTDAAVEAVENLIDSYEALATAMERVIELQKEMKNV